MLIENDTLRLSMIVIASLSTACALTVVWIEFYFKVLRKLKPQNTFFVFLIELVILIINCYIFSTSLHAPYQEDFNILLMILPISIISYISALKSTNLTKFGLKFFILMTFVTGVIVSIYPIAHHLWRITVRPAQEIQMALDTESLSRIFEYDKKKLSEVSNEILNDENLKDKLGKMDYKDASIYLSKNYGKGLFDIYLIDEDGLVLGKSTSTVSEESFAADLSSPLSTYNIIPFEVGNDKNYSIYVLKSYDQEYWNSMEKYFLGKFYVINKAGVYYQSENLPELVNLNGLEELITNQGELIQIHRTADELHYLYSVQLDKESLNDINVVFISSPQKFVSISNIILFAQSTIFICWLIFIYLAMGIKKITKSQK